MMRSFNKIYQKGLKLLLHSVYWLISFLILSYIFIDPEVYASFSFSISATIIVVSIVLVLCINYYVIPQFLFKKRYWLFFYLIVFLVIVSVWVNLSLLTAILYYSIFRLNNLILPDKQTITMLLTGNYLIVFLAILIHFVRTTLKESQKTNLIEKQKLEAELKLNQAKLELLKDQIHPHFLFNTLNNLYGLCLEKSDRAVDVVLKISELLDYMLYQCNEAFVSVNNEIKFLENYIDLESLRIDERLKLDLKIEKKNEAFRIAPLILFPFIENAFKHSALNNAGKRIIFIEILFEQDVLILHVKNNFSEKTNQKNVSSGIGLENVRHRLSLIYPDKHVLTIREEQNSHEVELKLILNDPV